MKEIDLLKMSWAREQISSLYIRSKVLRDVTVRDVTVRPFSVAFEWSWMTNQTRGSQGLKQKYHSKNRGKKWRTDSLVSLQSLGKQRTTVPGNNFQAF